MEPCLREVGGRGEMNRRPGGLRGGGGGSNTRGFSGTAPRRRGNQGEEGTEKAGGGGGAWRGMQEAVREGRRGREGTGLAVFETHPNILTMGA